MYNAYDYVVQVSKRTKKVYNAYSWVDLGQEVKGKVILEDIRVSSTGVTPNSGVWRKSYVLGRVDDVFDELKGEGLWIPVKHE